MEQEKFNIVQNVPLVALTNHIQCDYEAEQCPASLSVHLVTKAKPIFLIFLVVPSL